MHHKKIRFLYMLLAGSGIFLLLDQLAISEKTQHHYLFGYATSVIITIFVWEGNLIIDRFMNLGFPWHKSAGKRILVHLPVSLVFSSVTIYISMLSFDKYMCPVPSGDSDRFFFLAITIGTLVSIIILSIEIGTQFFTSWKKSLVEVEKYKAQSLQAQLQNLKDQINPHFMFNNLSVLSSLVYKDQDKAVDFINQLSKVYRYLLDSHSCELVNLGDELTFVYSYTYLLQIRFDKNLAFYIETPEESKSLLLPPMALQILIENAIKHNEVSEELPLHIRIRVQGDTLEVSNNLQLRTYREAGSKKGLSNIKERYKFFTDREATICETKTEFTVKIPLLRSK